MGRIGILGGGQLARMLVLAGVPLGLRFEVADPAAGVCAGDVAPLLTVGWDDFGRMQDFARGVDVVTFDFENVPAATASWFAGRTEVHPNPGALAVSQDRLSEKNLFREVGIATTAYAPVDDRASFDAALGEIGLPVVLKTRRCGYDGKGQAVIHSAADVESAWLALGGKPLILEGFVPFSRELSVIAVRSASGEFRHYPLTQNWHVDGILQVSLAPAAVSAALESQAVVYARALAERLDYVGVVALELFERDGQLLGNEMAPRVHNSGHWTIEGAVCSQFENHLRGILDLPLGDTSARGSSAMLNWIGELPDARVLLGEAGAHWHDYGKAPRPGRKLGHATVCATTPMLLRERLQRVGELLGRAPQIAPALAELERIARG